MKLLHSWWLYCELQMGFETPKDEEILRLLTPHVLAALNRKKRFILTIHSAP